MKLSSGFIKTAFKVTEKSTGRHFDCFIQNYDYMNGKQETRFNIGINGWDGWNFCFYMNEAEFNKEFTID